MEIKIKNNITKILIDINRSVSDMEHTSNSDNHIYIDLLLSQICYLTDNLNILKNIIDGDVKINNEISKNIESYNKNSNIAKDNNFLLQDSNNTNQVDNKPHFITPKQEILVSTETIPFTKDASTNKAAIAANNNVNQSSEEITDSVKQRQALKNVISLNDKFTFVRYLFKNNITIYSEHINNIDKLTTKEEVLTYINKYLSKLYDWDNYPDKKELFINIVEDQFA